jgi:hypothetical protein
VSSIRVVSSLTIRVNNFFLVVLYCYMRKFRAPAPSGQYLLCTFSAEMCQCKKSGNVCGLCPFCTQTNCRRTVPVFCQLGGDTARKVCKSARVCLRSAYTLTSFNIVYHVLCPQLFGVSSQSSHVVEGRFIWNV